MSSAAALPSPTAAAGTAHSNTLPLLQQVESPESSFTIKAHAGVPEQLSLAAGPPAPPPPLLLEPLRVTKRRFKKPRLLRLLRLKRRSAVQAAPPSEEPAGEAAAAPEALPSAPTQLLLRLKHLLAWCLPCGKEESISDANTSWAWLPRRHGPRSAPPSPKTRLRAAIEQAMETVREAAGQKPTRRQRVSRALKKAWARRH